MEKFLSKYLNFSERNFRVSLVRQFLIINPFFSLVFTLLYDGFDHLIRRFFVSYLITTIISVVISVAIYASVFLDLKLRQLWGKPKRTPPRFWWFGISLCAMPVGLYAAAQVLQYVRLYLDLGDVTLTPDNYKTGLVIGTLIGGIFFVIGIFVDARKSLRASELKLKGLENEHLKSQLSALTAQINPHLLFNSLNTVAALVATDPARAEETIVTLSELYRGVLNSSKNMVHSLKTELELCEAYLKIEKARFGERVRWFISIEEGLKPDEIHIPSLCLQPLVENSIKHGIAPKASGGRIEIKVSLEKQNLKIHVEDDGVGMNSTRTSSHLSTKGTGTGLSNSRERLKLHYGDFNSFSIQTREGGGTMIIIEIPIATQVKIS